MTVSSASAAASEGPFDLIFGVPVHPLVVHAAVVLVPIAALGLIVMAVSPRFSRQYGWLVVACSAAALGACFVAKEAGEALAERVGQPGFDHASFGSRMPIFALALTAAVVALWFVDRSTRRSQPGENRGRGGGLRLAVAVVAMLVALANIGWVVKVGHTGAKSVWSGVVSVTEPTAP